MMEIRLKSTYLELLFLCLSLLTVLGPANGAAVVRVTEGSEAVLSCFISPKKDITRDVFEWKKDGQKEVFFYENGKHYNNGRKGQDEQFKGRVSHFPDQLQSGVASIVINNTKWSDRGIYTCDFSPDQPNRQTYNIKLVVAAVVRVKEGSEAVLPCLIRPERDITRDLFDWKKDDQEEVFFYENGIHYNNGRDGQDEQFKGRVSNFQDQLQSGVASIKIRDTKLSDSGNYTCDFPLLQPAGQIFYIDLLVDCDTIKDRSKENIRGASLKPSVTLLHQTTDKPQLQCEVQRVFPHHKAEWKDSSGNNLHAEETWVPKRGGRYDIILKTTVTETGNYSCVVTQEDICHQVSAETFVNVPGPEPVSGLPIGLVVAALLNPLIIVVVGGVVLAVLYKKRVITINSKKGSQIDKKKNPTELDELNKKFDTSGV